MTSWYGTDPTGQLDSSPGLAKRAWGRFDFIGNTVYVPVGQTVAAIFGTLPPTQCHDNAYLTVDGTGSGD